MVLIHLQTGGVDISFIAYSKFANVIDKLRKKYSS